MHFGLADPYDCPKCGQLECVIFVSGGLRSRYPLMIIEKNLEACSKYSTFIEKAAVYKRHTQMAPLSPDGQWVSERLLLRTLYKFYISSNACAFQKALPNQHLCLEITHAVHCLRHFTSCQSTWNEPHRWEV